MKNKHPKKSEAFDTRSGRGDASRGPRSRNHVRRLDPGRARSDVSEDDRDIDFDDDVGEDGDAGDQDELDDLAGDLSADDDEEHWDVFIPDDGDEDPRPEAGDFWIDAVRLGCAPRLVAPGGRAA